MRGTGLRSHGDVDSEGCVGQLRGANIENCGCRDALWAVLAERCSSSRQRVVVAVLLQHWARRQQAPLLRRLGQMRSCLQFDAW